MKFHRSFRVQAPLAAVEEFHSTASALEALTPKLVPMKVLSTPEHLLPGTSMTFRLWIGPVPVRWTARLEALEDSQPGKLQAEEAGFADVQEEGPFAFWRHEHRFTAETPTTTRVDDTIEARLRPHPLWGPVGLAMWVGLPVLFAYRGWKTRRVVEG